MKDASTSGRIASPAFIKSVFKIIFGILVVDLFQVQPVNAQSIWTSRDAENSIELEYLRPIFTSSASMYSGFIFTLSSRIRLGSENHLILELPMLSGSYSGGSDDNGVGNPYIGLEIQSPGSLFFGEIGVRPPFIADHLTSAYIVGVEGDFDRFEAYVPHLMQVGGAVNFHPVSASGIGCRLRVGPSLTLYTKGGSSEMYLAYSAILSYENEYVEAGAGVAGNMVVTSEVDDRSVDQLEIGLRACVDRFRPGFQIRVPLDTGLRNDIDYVYGINLAVEF